MLVRSFSLVFARALLATSAIGGLASPALAGDASPKCLEVERQVADAAHEQWRQGVITQGNLWRAQLALEKRKSECALCEGEALSLARRIVEAAQQEVRMGLGDLTEVARARRELRALEGLCL